ncbi:MAG TPA: PAS domain S-box protein [Jatrophihabitans sp.]|nr:PAS domain S-box protein [Jatrophihabitans sp.]
MLAASDAVVQGLLAAAPLALLAVDDDGVILFANDYTEHLFGWPRAELVGQPVECVVPDGVVGRHIESRRGPESTPPDGSPEAVPGRCGRRRDGSLFPAEISLNTFQTADGMVVAVAVGDATVSRRRESRFRALLASAPDATIGVNGTGRIELVNAQAERLFGWTAAELIGEPVEVLVPTGIRDRLLEYSTSYRADPPGRPAASSLQLSGLGRDGRTFPAEITLSAVPDEGGKLLVLAAVRDIRERIELEAERQRHALQAQREQSDRLESLGELAGGVAHDFNNLLGVILNYVVLTARRVEDPVAVADLGEIRAAAQRGAALTRQLLTFARRDPVNREPLNVGTIVRGVGSMLGRTLGADIDLQLELGDTPVIATCDRSQLEQILMNLAINARDAMPNGGRLTIAAGYVTEEDGLHRRMVQVSVSDTGTGMSADVTARAFEPFFTTKARGRGTGLGLATVYGIVRQNEGDVHIRSVVDEGTTVRVRLPGAGVVTDATRDEVAKAVEFPAPHVHARGHERILLVEDEAPLRVGTSRLLAESGYDVVVAVDGVEALEVFDREPDSFDLVLTDVAMPRMPGDELARQLKARSSGVPVIMMTGYDSGTAPRSGQVLAKPVGEKQLLETIREVLDD